MTIIKIFNLLLVIIFLYGCGGADEKSVSTVPITPNTKPIANAGDDQSAEKNVVIILDGKKSNDNDGDALTYQWSLVTVPEGSSVELTAFTTESSSFTPDSAGLYEAQLIVNDGKLSSEPSIVSIIVTQNNEAPTAIAGNNIETYVFMEVFLDGGASFDPENSELSYSWSIIISPENSNSHLTRADTKKPHFWATLDGDYVLQLIVTDDEGASSRSDIMITVKKRGQKDVVLLTQELSDNKAKWGSQNIEHYQIDQYVSCYCSPTLTLPVVMQVQKEDKSLLYYTTNVDWYGVTVIDHEMIVPNDAMDLFKTVNDMFDYIETTISDADEITVSYHPELGYPLTVRVNWDLSSVDDEISFNITNFINLSDINCDDIEKKHPNVKLSIVDEYTADPINCDVIVDLKSANGELKQVVNDGYLPVDDFGVSVAGPMRCINNLPFLVETETGMTSLKISKTGYITKTAELDIPTGESCGLIPTDIEVKLEPVN